MLVVFVYKLSFLHFTQDPKHVLVILLFLYLIYQDIFIIIIFRKELMKKNELFDRYIILCQSRLIYKFSFEVELG